VRRELARVPNVFISYCSADRDRIGLLAKALEADGFDVWWDRALLPGVSYEGEIEKALEGAKAVIVAWTPAAAESMWVRSEADDARISGRLVPILLKPAKIPKPFDRLHTADLTRWTGDRGGFGFPELAEAVRARVGG
jgi:hypothetical protein